jgi:hypothetical protein
MPAMPANLSQDFLKKTDPPPFQGLGNSPPLMPAPPKETQVSQIQNAATQIQEGPNPFAMPAAEPQPPPRFNQNSQVSKVGDFSQIKGLKKSNTAGTARRAIPANTLATRSGITNAGIRYRAPAKPPASDTAKALVTFLFLAAVLGGLYMVAPKKVRNTLLTKVTAIMDTGICKILGKQNCTQLPNNTPPVASTKPRPKTGDPGAIDVGSRGLVKVVIKSTPARAQIFLNGADQRQVTPWTFELDANKKYTLTLMADGYLTYTAEFTAVRDNQNVSATLTQTKIGYLNIRLFNAGVDTKVFVDDVWFNKDGQSLTMRPVQADKPIRIKAKNEFTGAIAEKTVSVGVDQKADVDLILTKPNSGAKEN